MKIYNQYRWSEFGWGIALLSVFASKEYWGFTILGIVFEFPRTQTARDIHQLIS